MFAQKVGLENELAKFKAISLEPLTLFIPHRSASIPELHNEYDSMGGEVLFEPQSKFFANTIFLECSFRDELCEEGKNS